MTLCVFWLCNGLYKFWLEFKTGRLNKVILGAIKKMIVFIPSEELCYGELVYETFEHWVGA